MHAVEQIARRSARPSSHSKRSSLEALLVNGHDVLLVGGRLRLACPYRRHDERHVGLGERGAELLLVAA